MNAILKAHRLPSMYRELFFVGVNLLCLALALALFLLEAVLAPRDVEDDYGRIGPQHHPAVELSSPARFKSELLLAPALRFPDKLRAEPRGGPRVKQGGAREPILFAGRGLPDSHAVLMRDQASREAVTLRAPTVGIGRSPPLQRHNPLLSHDLRGAPSLSDAGLLQTVVQLHQAAPVKFATLEYRDGAGLSDAVTCIPSHRRYHDVTGQSSVSMVIVAEDPSRDAGHGGKLLTGMSADADIQADPDLDPDAVFERTAVSVLLPDQTLAATNVAALSKLIPYTFIPPRWSTS